MKSSDGGTTMKMTQEQFEARKHEIIESNIRDYEKRDEELNNLRREYYQGFEVGDGATVHYYTDAEAYTVIRRTPKMLVLQRDRATLKEGWKPEFITGGFAGHCINQHEQEYDYEQDPEGHTIKVYWSDKRGAFLFNDKCVTPGRHEFYDYNF